MPGHVMLSVRERRIAQPPGRGATNVPRPGVVVNVPSPFSVANAFLTVGSLTPSSAVSSMMLGTLFRGGYSPDVTRCRIRSATC